MARERERRLATALEAYDSWRKVCKVMGNSRRRAQPAPPPFVRDDQTEVTAASFTDAAGPGTYGAPPPRRR
jgi:hypothetical protein